VSSGSGAWQERGCARTYHSPSDPVNPFVSPRDHSGKEEAMKYVLLIHEGTSPPPEPGTDVAGGRAAARRPFPPDGSYGPK
jgi:hypothetical protein